MKRALTTGLAVALLLPALLWGGFRVWLAAQPMEFRAQVEQYSSLEFLSLLRDYVAPPPIVDLAGYGRREALGRGDAPWVKRSALDGRPRMLTAAFAPGLRAAWSTETAALHLFWRGDVDYTGPVYDDRHGAEPTSRGEAYLRSPATPAWWVETDAGWSPARVRWKGHGFDPETGALWLRYEVGADDGATRIVTERPEHEREVVAPAAGLIRRFTLSDGPAIALEVGLEEPEADPEGTSVTTDATWVGSRLVFRPETRRARIALRFERPVDSLEVSQAEESESDPFARHDCHTCHGERERVVGPAWSEVALRHAGANRRVALERLARRIREGGVGEWGDVVMPPHPEISRPEAARLAEIILETPPSEAPVLAVDAQGAPATWTFHSDTEAPPQELHPSLASTPLRIDGFTPKVGGLAWLPGGRLAVSTWDPDGAVFAIDGWNDPEDEVRVTRIADGLHEPLGIAVADGALYVMQKQEITRLIDANRDDLVDEYRTVSTDWKVTSNFHEFGFGLVAQGEHLYAGLAACILNGGKSCRHQTEDRGHVIRVHVPTGRVERIASGLRTPNGLALAPDGSLFVTDNQGDWLPSSKLVRVRTGATYGWRAPGEERTREDVTPPALWLPQNEVGNSPTQPLFLEVGPYAGQVIFGDIFNGGLKRAALEEVEGAVQGAAFHFSGGFEAPINRLLAWPADQPGAPHGGFVVGEIGSRGNWGERGKEIHGLEVVRFGEERAFEPWAVRARSDGFEVELTRPLAGDVNPSPGDFTLRDWFYVASPIYGGPKYDLRTLSVEKVTLSTDRTRLHLIVPELRAGRVVYLKLDPRLRSAEGERLWVDEAWYTLNAIPRPAASSNARIPSSVDREDATPFGDPRPTRPGDPTEIVSAAPSPRPPNTLTRAERAAGWRLLFDGESFEGWKIYGAQDGEIPHWEIDDAALHFTRDVSLAGLVWNHLNPFSKGALDLMTVERFGDFELSIDWRISPGGNSGIFYLVPDETTRLSWDLAPEMQVLDDAGHMDGRIDRHRAGDLYDLQSLARGAARPVGEWNTARIRVEGPRIRHWLNDVLIADIERGSDAWAEAIAASKFDGTPGFAMAERGHITLQDHGDPVWFRDVKIRTLD